MFPICSCYNYTLPRNSTLKDLHFTRLPEHKSQDMKISLF